MSENRKIRFTTNKGEFIVEMFEDKAPKTTKNFIELTEKGFYNGVVFHRVIDGFMIQGGDPTGTGMGGPGMTLIYLAARLIAVAVKLFRTGHVVESLLLVVASLVAITLVAIFGNEKSILVAALLSWVFLAVAFIRFVLRNGENDPRQQSYLSEPPHDQDPNSLNFSGVGPGF